MSEAPAIDWETIKAKATPEELLQLQELFGVLAQDQVFYPTPKQREVIENEADIIGYGGAAGGGKSYLVTGLTTMHRRSSITRPQKNQTDKFVNELAKMLGTREGYSSQQSAFRFTLSDGVERYVKFFGLDNPGDEEKQQGDDYDLKAYDEVTQMREADIRYTLTWNRTDVEGQRVRAVLTMNPPTTAEGRWVIRYFAPWLDPAHPNPAKDGELRYFATIGDNKDYELADGRPFVIERNAQGQLYPEYEFDPAGRRPEEIFVPKSRTFIRARVTDNPYYMKTGYISVLQNLPEPLRSQMLNGDFMAGVEDDARQVIPTRWIELAQERWRQRAPLIKSGQVSPGPMDSVGCDVARGGNMGGAEVAAGSDELVIATRYGTFFAELGIHKGLDINSGDKAAALIITAKRDEAPIHVDVVGVGTSVYDFLKVNNQHVIPVNGASSGIGTDKATGTLRFMNKRAELYWRMREALDPTSGDNLALPPDPQLLGDLAAARWSLSKAGIQIEEKDAIKKRLGRSPDRGEAVILANLSTPKRRMVLGGLLGSLPNQESWEQKRLRELEG